MCVVKFNHDQKCKMINRKSLGRAVKGALTQAKVERRLICGLLPAISYLEKSPDDVLLCVVTQSRPGDAASHMQTVLLQAFCYENYIPVIQVDCGEKLAEFCATTIKDKPLECSCAIIVRDLTVSPINNDNNGQVVVVEEEEEEIPMSSSEKMLIDFYEHSLEEHPRPVIELPR